jgi:hypothetical protein
MSFLRITPVFAAVVLMTATMMTSIAGAAPAAPAKAAPRHAVATPTGRMVSTRTTTGKKITYNCSKAGNAAKKACK